jgi:glycosyltransferase involved in cell wall biosynthesis
MLHPDGSMEPRSPVEPTRGVFPAPLVEASPGPADRLRILHLIVTLGHSNAQYNEHCLPMRFEREITICSFTPASVDVPPEITVFEGDGTVRGFRRALERALAADDHDVVHAHAPGTGAALAFGGMHRQHRMANAVLTVHNARTSFSLRNQAIMLSLFASFPTVIFCSRSAFVSFPRRFRDLRGGLVAIVPNGVDTARVDAALDGEIGSDGRFRVVSVGRMITRKDPVTLLRAFRLACGEGDQLRYVGDGSERAKIVREADRSGLGARLEVTGAVERDEVYRQVASSSLFISTSRGEGLPVAVLEAMACARPVVLSDIAPHREIAGDDDAVRLVKPGDALGFAREIRRFREMSPAGRSEVGRRCRAVVEERFGLATMHRSYEHVYERMLTRGRGGTLASTETNRSEGET